jgi:hypothetical protein
MTPIVRAGCAAGVLLALVLAPALPMFAAASRPAGGVFAFPSLEVSHIARIVEDTNVIGGPYDEDTHNDYPDETDFLTVLEGGKLIAWYVFGDFAGSCPGSNGIAILYAASGSKSAPVTCDGTELGLDGAKVRRVFSGTYRSTATVTGDIVELTGTMSGHSRFYYRASDASPTHDTTGTVRQHVRIQVSRAGCRVLLWESRSDAREDYDPTAHDGSGGHRIKDSVWLDRGTGTTTCEFQAG